MLFKANVHAPPKAEWKYTIGNLTVHAKPNNTPNRFHRWMQNLILGLDWRKI